MNWLWKIVKKYNWVFIVLADIAILIGICLFIRFTDKGWWAIPLWFLLNFAILNGLQYQNQREWDELRREILNGRPWYK